MLLTHNNKKVYNDLISDYLKIEKSEKEEVKKMVKKYRETLW